MNIGIFDSGLGGLFTMKSLTKKLPQYNYIYLGDTKRLPYGNRSQEAVYQFTKEGIDFLFKKNCSLVIVACNTASAEAVRKIQQEYLPKKYPNKKVLGMIVPIVEEASGFTNVCMIATTSTVQAKAYDAEFKKRSPKTKLYSLGTPLLVPMIEYGGTKWIQPILESYLKKLPLKKSDALILGCTHYPIIKKEIRKLIPKNVQIISQDTIIPKKTKEYLARHNEIEKGLEKKKKREFYVTDKTALFETLAKNWFDKKIVLKKVVL